MNFPAEDDSDEEIKPAENLVELPTKPAQRRKPLTISSDEEPEKKEANGGTTGTTNDINFGEETSHDPFPTEEATSQDDPLPAEMPSPKPLELPTDKKKGKRPNFELAIDTEEINKQFNYGGEHGSLCEEEAI